MFEIKKGLYLGNIHDASNSLSHISSEKTSITHLLSLIELPILPTADNNIIGTAFSFENKPLDSTPHENPLRRFEVLLIDDENENLIDKLVQCLEFIEEGMKCGGSVLVHCHAGVSRSPAVIAAYLMKIENLSFDEAISSIRCVCEFVSPNDGFVHQLKLFKKMNCQVDTSYPPYKLFQLSILVRDYSEGRPVELSKFAVDPFITLSLTTSSLLSSSSSSLSYSSSPSSSSLSLPSTSSPSLNSSFNISVNSSNTNNSSINNININIKSNTDGHINSDINSTSSNNGRRAFQIYRCKKCRRVVASSANILQNHSAIPIDNEFEFNTFQKDHKKMNKNSKKYAATMQISPKTPTDGQCSSIFVEPMQWMVNVRNGEVKGKLLCIQCSNHLGNFHWFGNRCNCGTWVTPAFQIHKSRVDEDADHFNVGFLAVT